MRCKWPRENGIGSWLGEMWLNPTPLATFTTKLFLQSEVYEKQERVKIMEEFYGDVVLNRFTPFPSVWRSCGVIRQQGPNK